MINPSMIMKLMTLKDRFTQNHPGVTNFFGNIRKQGLPVDSVIEISVEKPDGSRLTTNMKVSASDLELLEEIKTLS